MLATAYTASQNSRHQFDAQLTTNFFHSRVVSCSPCCKRLDCLQVHLVGPRFESPSEEKFFRETCAVVFLSPLSYTSERTSHYWSDFAVRTNPHEFNYPRNIYTRHWILNTDFSTETWFRSKTGLVVGDVFVYTTHFVTLYLLLRLYRYY
jgi:hypothetical protein